MRKWKQRLFSLLLCGAMLVSLCAPAAAVEKEDGTQETYIALTWNGSKLVKDTSPVPADITEITEDNVETLVLDEAAGGWYIVRDNDVFSGSYDAGIEVNAGSTVAIHGGEVTATGFKGAGIGDGTDYIGDNSGTFAADGNAFIVASSISDNEDTTGWSGVIFVGTTAGSTTAPLPSTPTRRFRRAKRW